jgi:hypothetical protein
MAFTFTTGWARLPNGSAGVITVTHRRSFIMGLFVGRRYVSFNRYFRMCGMEARSRTLNTEGTVPTISSDFATGISSSGEEGKRTRPTATIGQLWPFEIFHANCCPCCRDSSSRQAVRRTIDSSHVDKIAVGIGIDGVTGTDVAAAV